MTLITITHDHLHDHHSHDHHSHDHGGRRIIQLERDLLGRNQELAEENRRYLRELGVPTFNLVSSPGSGKTTLLARTIQDLKDRYVLAVIEGDQQTSRDAERIAAAGAPAIQINTGKGCHLDAQMVAQAMPKLPLAAGRLLFIENVGNLVCPAEFDLGETRRIVILSVTEGEDKPLKYPHIFASSDLMLLTKIDLLPYLSFDVAQCLLYARRINPALESISVSASTGEGLEQWYDWLAGQTSERNKAECVTQLAQPQQR
jgi:hydrogenase nickel incorporation protein HypB